MKSTLMIVLLQISTIVGQNLIENSDFDGPIEEGTWEANNCQINRTSEASITGDYSMKVTQRSQPSDTATYKITPEQGLNSSTVYYGSAFLKIDSQVHMHHELQFAATMIASGRTLRKIIGRMYYVLPCHGWTKIGGEFRTDPDTTEVKLAFAAVTTAEVDFYVDAIRFFKVAVEDDWKEKAAERIEKMRKGNVTINFNIKDDVNLSGINVSVEQTRNAFPFGVAVNVKYLTGTDDVSKKYQDYVFDMFNFFTIENNLKLRIMEPVEGDVQFSNADLGLDTIQRRGPNQVRLHSVSWAKKDKLPSWMPDKNPEELFDHLQKRCDYLSERYKDRFSHWDVNNEKLHGNWYENRTGNAFFTPDLIKYCYSVNKAPKYFTNDYDVIAKGVFTQAYHTQVSNYVKSGVPISGMGLQCHMNNDVDIQQIKTRLDVMASAGVPLFITELDIKNRNVDQKAEHMEDLLRLFFSYPLVEGIVLWKFWDQQEDETAFLQGSDFVENKVGEVVRRLYKEEWKTKQTFELKRDSQSEDFRAFYGEYVIKVYNASASVESSAQNMIGNFTFDFERGQKPNINISVSNEGIDYLVSFQ